MPGESDAETSAAATGSSSAPAVGAGAAGAAGAVVAGAVDPRVRRSPHFLRDSYLIQPVRSHVRQKRQAPGMGLQNQ